jgi:hypothetical protein
VAYALRITDLDPIKHKLLFERFLNPERISMPDIDLDFDERRRGDMIRYATEKYGEERVSQIITYGTIKAKAAVKDAARVLGLPLRRRRQDHQGDAAAVMGKDVPLAGIFDPSHKRYGEAGEFRALYESDPDAKAGRRHRPRARGAQAPVGRARRRRHPVPRAAARRHPDPPPRAGRRDHHPVRHGCLRDARPAEDGLPRACATSPSSTTASSTSRPTADETVVLEELDEMQSDPKTYELLARGDTLGVFQLDGGPMRSLLRSMQPDRFESISAVLALYRPGPMGVNAHNDYADRKTGRKPVVPIHPELGVALEDILGDTYGLIVYQEQVMAIAQKLAGYTLGAADLLRRAMGKKKREILDKEYIPFSDGMKANGYSDGRDQDAVGHPRPVRRLRLQPRPHRRLRAGQLLDGLPQGELPGRVHGRAADVGQGRQGQERAVPRRVPAHGHQGAAARRQRLGLRLHPARHRHPLRPVGDPQRRHQRRRLDRRDPRGQGPLRRLRRLPAQGRGGGLQQEDRSSRCARPAPSTPSATAARGWCTCTPRRSRRAWRPRRRRRSGSSTCSA